MTIKKLVESITQEVKALQGDHTKDKRYESSYTYPDEIAARQGFAEARQKLLAVNTWSDLPGLTATFTVHDPQGKPITNAPLVVGNYIRIDLPGPLPHNWVRVVKLDEADESAEFTVVPSEKPQSQGVEEGAPVEHFFTDEASSTFRVERVGTTLLAAEIGRNERVNNDEATAGQRSVVNTLMAAGGWAMFQETQWKKLMDYLVQPYRIDSLKPVITHYSLKASSQAKSWILLL
ncbi:hypothetical protein GK091_24980 [Spirosoma agri]|uniref:Uncharacterized protein n=1 Tax=Spirosoma agri TaxID=1987381 RepID=A0A6M0IRP1_9BACT|nr:hypothetical protein [Spirosoma agri]NEU70155.1 hypothetical protein [Spirosoma agri]